MIKEIEYMMKVNIIGLIGIEVIYQIGEKILKISREDWINNLEEICQQLEGQELEKSK